MAYSKAPRPRKLKPEELKWTCSADSFDFESTNALKPIEGIIGQERALKALKLGVDLKSPGYNIFITGLSGTGKYTTIKKTLEAISPNGKKLYDYAYVNNFKDPDRPILLIFPAGKARQFKEDLSTAIKFLLENIPQVLETEPFISRKKQLFNEYSESQQAVMYAFEDKLRKDNFTLGQVKVGELTRPEILAVIEDQPVFIQQLDEQIRAGKLTEAKAKQFREKYTGYQEELQILFKNSMKMSQEFQQKVIELEKFSVEDVLSVAVDELKSTYKIKKVRKFLDLLSEDVLQNLEIFKSTTPENNRLRKVMK